MVYHFQIEEIDETAKLILTHFPHHRTFLLKGALGAGKTTLIKSFVKHFAPDEEVSSPTYALVNEYSSPRGLIAHFDLYRAKNESEIFDLGFWEYVENEGYLFVEWPEKIIPYLKVPYLELSLEILGGEKRALYVEEYSS